jgi:transcriptional regulator GlxA family with amidase domain
MRRTFARRFGEQTRHHAHRWLMHQRLLAAQRRLESSSASIDQVAQAVGLETAATLRHYFNRVLDTTPTAYRRRFSMRDEMPGDSGNCLMSLRRRPDSRST